MAQLRHDYAQFRSLNAEVLVIVPNGPHMIARYVSSHDTPYPILSDKGSRVAEQYGIATRRAAIVKFTTYKPTLFLVERTGRLLYANYLTSYIREPDHGEPLAILADRARQHQRET